MTAEPQGCDPERVTGWVDQALEEEARGRVEAHLAGCPFCRDQAAFERELRRRLGEMPSVELPPDLAARVEHYWRPRRLRRIAMTFARVVLPAAAVLALAAFWAIQTSPVIGWQLATDHRLCFGPRRLPAKVWGNEPERIAAWFEKQGVKVPLMPASAAGVELVGGRFCYLKDRRVVHLYYTGPEHRLSVFVVPDPVRLAQWRVRPMQGETVRFVRSGGAMVGLVAEKEETVAAFARALNQSVAGEMSDRRVADGSLVPSAR